MNKRAIVLGLLGTVVALLVLVPVIFWLAGPMSLGPAPYVMGPGMMYGGWGGFTWLGLLFGLIPLLFWLVPVLLITFLVAGLFRSSAPNTDG